MKVPQEEMAKFKELNDLMYEFCELRHKIQFRQIYSEKLQLLLQNSTRKTVGCEAKFRLNKELNDDGSEKNTHSRWGYGGTCWVLTREGIKEEFGYTGEFKCRKPTSSIWWDSYSENTKCTASLIKLLNDKGVRSKDALKEHIQLRRDIARLQIADGEYFKKVTLKTPFNIPIAVEDDEYIYDGVAFSTDTIAFKLDSGWHASVDMVDGKVTFQARSTYSSATHNYNTHNSLQENVKFVQFLRYSEPEVYDELVKQIKHQIVEVNKYITEKTKEVEAVIAKYGHYLVYSEL